jgi:hypothetical protein
MYDEDETNSDHWWPAFLQYVTMPRLHHLEIDISKRPSLLYECEEEWTEIDIVLSGSQYPMLDEVIITLGDKISRGGPERLAITERLQKVFPCIFAIEKLAAR